MKDTSKLHLLLPDIIWPLEENKLQKPPVRFSTLEKLLTRSRSVPFQGKDITETLFHLFAVKNDPGADYPVGAVSYLGSGGETTNKCWAKATPVHLLADGDGVLLIGPEQLNITSNEAEYLANDFNEHFKQDRLSLLIHDQDNWYLNLPQCPKIMTYDIDYVSGHNIERYLPSGPDGSEWVNIINETQMLFYQSSVNQHRMGLESATINGLWFSGFGILPSAAKEYGAIYTTLPLAKGLARLSNTIYYESQISLEEILCFDEETIFTYTKLTDSKRSQDLSQWEEALMHIDHVLRRILNSGAFGELSIYNCMGKAFQVNQKSLRKGFWKPNKSIFNAISG
jgi:hypothetical protein